MLIRSLLLTSLVAAACHADPPPNPTNARPKQTAATASADPYTEDRMDLIDTLSREIHDPRVLDAMRRVPRHRFVPEALKGRAYENRPLPIGEGQTISQPFIVAYMTEQLQLKPSDKVLEIGTGSGYQAAILAELVKDVYSIEIVPELAQRAEKTLEELGYRNIHVRAGDGYRGWPEVAPFDAIIVTAAPDHVPQPLVEQLAVGGRLVIPVGDYYQEMTIITKSAQGVVEKKTIPVVFVPMTGEAEKR